MGGVSPFNERSQVSDAIDTDTVQWMDGYGVNSMKDFIRLKNLNNFEIKKSNYSMLELYKVQRPILMLEYYCTGPNTYHCELLPGPILVIPC